MQRERDEQKQSSELRKRAEKKIERRISSFDEQPSADLKQVLHELQVHQIEIEMQNEELRRASHELEESQRRYLDIYEFAPIGYFVGS